MGFKPQGMPSAFTRSANPGQSKRPYQIDLLVTIDSYDVGSRQLYCTGEDGTKMMVRIRPDTVDRNIQRAKDLAGTRPQAPKWEGYMIDQRMADSLPVGQKIVIERAERTRTIQQNGQSISLMDSDRIINVADPSPDKTFEGLFSISTYQNHVFHVQRWEERGILIDDQAQIARIREELDAGSSAFLNKELRPHSGVQFRVVVPGPTATDKCTVLDTSPPFDWIPRQFDSNGVEISAGRPLDGNKFMELLFDETDGYLGYVKSKFPETQYPGRFIEVCPYINYRAGPRSRYMAIPEKQFDPLYKLANTQTRLAMDDNSFSQGKNMAVKGVLQLSADQVDMNTRSFKPRNIAVRLHATGPMGHVHAWIRTFDGRKTQPHEALRQIPVQRATPGEKSYAPPPSHGSVSMPPAAAPMPSAAPTSPSPAPAASSGFDQMSAFDDWDDGDPFTMDSDHARHRLDEARRNMNGGQ